MAGRLGRVLVGGKDCGAGFALGPRVVVTANHVVRNCGDKPVAYVPITSEPIAVEKLRQDPSLDAAVLTLASDLGEFLPVCAAVAGAEWRVMSPLSGGDPELHGTISTARRTIQNASGATVDVVQLHVNEELGDYGGYSGSAVLDALGLVALALLVEQVPLRTGVTATAIGEKKPATNVLYAVPIGDVITALDLKVENSKPLRFDVGVLPPRMVKRQDLLDEAVRRVVEAKAAADHGPGTVVLRGPGGAGKTVLARLIAHDERVWAAFPDGIHEVRAGPHATADGVVDQLKEALGYRDRDLADALSGQRRLFIIDDVWDPNLLITLRRSSLPSSVTVLATARGIRLPGIANVSVGAVNSHEAIQILAGDTARSDELDRALGRLAATLFCWPLLLTLAAAYIHRDDERHWSTWFDDDPNSQLQGPDPDLVIARAESLRRDFPDNPLMIDDPDTAAQQSVEFLVGRSLEWLGPEPERRFKLLAVYEPGTAITEPMLEDLWETKEEPTQTEIDRLIRAGFVQPVRSDRQTIGIHDLITAWLRHTCGRPDDADLQPVHRRLAGLAQLADGNPGDLTRDRAEWLAYHLVAARDWEKLKALPTLRWRSQFSFATGSDAVFLAGLDYYGREAVIWAPDAVYHAVRAWIFAAHVLALIGRLPVPLLVAMALLRDPLAALTEACQHPKAGEVVPAVLAAVSDRPDARLSIEQAVALIRAIPDEWERHGALAGIAGGFAVHLAEPAMLERALAVAETLPNEERSTVLAAIVEQLAAADPLGTALLERGLAVTESIPDSRYRSEALAALAERMTDTNPKEPALFERAVTAAGTLDQPQQSWVLAVLAEKVAGADPNDPLFERAESLALTIPDDTLRGRTLVGITARMFGARSRDQVLLSNAQSAVAAMPDHERCVVLRALVKWPAGAPEHTAALIGQAAAVVMRTIPDAWDRSWLLIELADRMADANPMRTSALLDQALTAAQGIPETAQLRSWVLYVLAMQAAVYADPKHPALLEQALAVAKTIPDETWRSQAQATISLVTESGVDLKDRALVRQALAIATSLPFGMYRSDALAELAERLVDADLKDATLVTQVLTAFETLPSPYWSTPVLAALAERLVSADPNDPVLLEKAITVTRSITDDNPRGKVLATVAERLVSADPSDPVLLEKAITVTRSITDDKRRGEVLATVAKRLLAADPHDPVLLEKAVAVAEIIPSGWQRSQALTALAFRLAGVDAPGAAALLDQAIAVAGSIPDAERGETLAVLAVELAGAYSDRAEALLGQALAAAEPFSDDSKRSDALGILACLLVSADPRDAPLFDRALAVAQTIPDDMRRSETLFDLVEKLPDEDPYDSSIVEMALTAANTIPDHGARSRALGVLAARLARANPARSKGIFDAAQALVPTEDPHRDAALAFITLKLASTEVEDTALLDSALAVANIIANDCYRSEALAALAVRLIDADPARSVALSNQAIAVADAISDDNDRVEALSVLAARLASIRPNDTAPFERAVTAAEIIPEHDRRSHALARLVVALAGAVPNDSGLFERAMTVAKTIPDSRYRSEALAALAVRLIDADPARSAALFDLAIAVAGTSPERDDALAQLSLQLAGAHANDPSLFDRALAVAETIHTEKRRVALLASLAEQLAAANPSDLTQRERALSVVETIPSYLEREAALERINVMPKSDLLDVLSDWRFRSVDDLIGILNLFLDLSHDKPITESISLAVLDVVVQFSQSSPPIVVD